MITEKEIVYSVLNSLRGSHSDNNDMLSERLIRSWINTERANLLLQFTDSGRSISEDTYQPITFQSQRQELIGDLGLYTVSIPKIIFFKRRSGIRIYHDNSVIVYCTKTQNRHYSLNIYLRNIQRAYLSGNKLFCYLKDNTIVNPLIDVDAVLQNPSDQPGYEWDSSPYPLESELISVLKNNVIERNASIINPSLNDNVNDFQQNNSNENR